MNWLLHRRWARALAIVGVYLLSLQSLGLSRVAFAEAVEECCCHARSANCHCPVCSHHRAIESGKPFLQSCSSPAAQVAIVAVEPALPAIEAGPAPRIAVLIAHPSPKSLIEAPPGEVPTPPPLARAV
jgi:hypothetical protein